MVLTLAVAVLSVAPGWAFDVKTAKLIDGGFKVFTTEKFNGNGRTCSTCHIPQNDYTISPADIAQLTVSAHQIVLGGKNVELENPTLVDRFGIFNITNDTPGQAGPGFTPAGPFRASMQLSGLALTSLNVCPDATLIATATTTGVPTAQITTATPPLFPFEVGEPIDINGVSVGTGGLVGAGYNGLGVYQISAVISPTTFQYRAFGGTTPVLGLPDGVGGGVTALLTVGGTAVPGAGACSTASGASGLGNVATFPVDTGTRFIELGWSGDGAPNDDTLFTPAGTKDFRCKEAVDAANANPANLTSVLSAFAMGAVRHHFAITNARVPGVDFRCPTDNELQEIAAFQEYLGRQYPSGTPLELALKAGTSFPGTQVSGSQPAITFNDSTAELGKTIFLDPNAGCNFCHFNGGASLSQSNVRTEPFGNPPQPFPGRNENEEQNVDLLDSITFVVPSTGQTLVGGLDGQTNIQLAGTDPGDGSPIGFTLTGPSSLGNIPIFNVQSIIEAPRKKSFFHNAAFTTSIEDAASFYFTDAFVANGNSAGFGNSAFEGPPLPNAGSLPNPLPRAPGQPEANPSGGPALALQELADTYFSPTDSVGGQDVLDTLGFFLRALNVVYSIADCERLTDDAIDRVQAGLPLEVPVLNCTTDLNDVNRVVGGAQVVVPSSYLSAQTEALQIATDLNEAAKERNAAKLTAIVSQLKTLRHSIATISPDLQ